MKLLKEISVIIGCVLSVPGFADDGELVVGIEASSPPFVFVDNSGEYNGFEIDLLTAIAKEAGLNVVFSNMPYDALLPSVLTEQADVAVSCIAMTEERKQIVDFAGPYYHSGLNALIPKSYQGKIDASADFKGKKICVVSGSTCEEYAKTVNSADVLGYATEQDSFDAIEQNKCDLLITDAPIIEYTYVKQNPDKYFMLKKNLTIEDFGIMISKLRPEIKEKIEKALKKLEESGEYNKLYKKWFG